MDTIQRINYYEAIFDEALEKVHDLQMAVDAYEAFLPKINELKEYYMGPQWRKDREDDVNGLIPQDLKRGILSEDGIYNMMTDEFELLNRMKEKAQP